MHGRSAGRANPWSLYDRLATIGIGMNRFHVIAVAVDNSLGTFIGINDNFGTVAASAVLLEGSGVLCGLPRQSQ